MSIRKRLIKTAVLLLPLIFGAFFFYNSSAATDLMEPNEEGYIFWKKEDDLSFDDMVSIDPGVTLVIEKGAEVKLGSNASIYVEGRIIAEGTKDDPIKISSDSSNNYYLIEFYPDIWSGLPEMEPSFLRYVEFSKGGYIEIDPCANGGCSAYLEKFFPKAFAFSGGLPALFFEGGKVHIENCVFYDNKYADVGIEYWEKKENSGNNYLEIVNSNFLGSSDEVAVESNVSCQNGKSDCLSVLLKNNWYGNYQGPTQKGSSLEKGKIISGAYVFEGYRNNDLISDPVIFVPGTMGSFEIAGKLFLDPILKIYDNLINSLDQNGYQENINLFKFPYEWRNSNAVTADLLKQKIQEVKNKTKVSKVDLVAHSMGGLISRYYIEGNNYQNDVDQLVTLGTPHKGSPKAYLMWEAGEKGINFEDYIIEKIFSIEAEHSGCDNLWEYIKEKVISVKELLPDYDYLEENGEMKDYPNGYPENDFLENLNKQINVDKLDKINFINIISKNKSTVSKFRVAKNTGNDFWEHGMPENYYDKNTDQGIEYDNGDGTVPLESAIGINADKTIELDANHTQLPSRSQCKVLAELSNKSEENCNYIRNATEVVSLLIFGVHSPIDIQIISPSGEKVGKDFENNGIINEIDGSYYTGFDTQNEFITIPNPEDGEYKILTQGTGDGDYKIEIAKISENENDPQNATESTAEITGTAINGSQEEKKIEVAGDEVSVEEAKDITSPTITAEILGEPNENGWYKNNVTVRFVAEDNESGIDGESQKDVIISSEGKSLSATETFSDKAGNIASKTVSGINIDKTAPVIEIISPEEQNYLNNQILEINYGVTDANNIEQQAYFDGNILNSDEIDLSLNNLKKHTFLVSAIDEAGNKSEKSVTFETVTNFGAIISNVGHYYNLGFIINQNTKNFLETKVQNIQKMEDLLNIFQSSLLPKWAKEVVIENLKRVINHEVDNLIFQIKNQKNISRNITSEAKTLLIESLNFIKK